MAIPSVEQAVTSASRAFVLPAGYKPSYGTAGFRAVAELLHSTIFRCQIDTDRMASMSRQPPARRLPVLPGLQVRHPHGRAGLKDWADHGHLHHCIPQPSTRQRRQAGRAQRGDALPGVGGEHGSARVEDVSKVLCCCD
jgi:hypothetical protein